MDRRSAAVGVAVVVAALAGAFVIVRTAKGPVVFGLESGDPTPSGAPPSRALGAGAELAPSRCIELAPATSLSDVAPGPLDFGDAVIDASGLVAIGVVRARGKERTAAVLTFAIGTLPRARAKASLIDLAPSLGDDPPPHPFIVERALFVARTESTRERRRMVIASVGAVDGAGNLTPTAPPLDVSAFEQTKDESLAFDVVGGATGLVVWDDDDRGRGVIRTARTSAREPATVSVTSPATTDAEAPRIVADGSGGAWVAWIARKSELDAGPAELAGHLVESPAEAREARWVELARVDGNGVLRGAPIRLAPGRVSDFDLRRAAGAAPVTAAVEVLMRDEQGESEARGARIVRQYVVVKEHDVLAAEPASVIVGEGVGAADPIAVDDGAAGLLSFVDTAERAQFFPLGAGPPAATVGDAADPARASRASAELQIEGGRVLASRPLTDLAPAQALAGQVGRLKDRGAIVIAAGSKQDRAEARILLCER